MAQTTDYSVFDNVKVDSTGMQVDRNTPLGKFFEKAKAEAEAETDPEMKNFKLQMLAYTEANAVIDATLPPKEAEEARKKLMANLGA